MVGTGCWNELKDQPGKDVEHGPKWGVHEGNDGSATAEFFLSFGQNVAGWKLTARTHCPRIGFAMLTLKGFDE